MLIDSNLVEFIARQALTEPYRQTDVVDTQRFSAWLRDRDVNLQWTTLYHLASIGILHPIIILENPYLDFSQPRFTQVDLGYGVNTYVDLGVAEIREDQLEPRDKLSTAPAELGRTMLWHPFQLWEAEQIARRLQLNIAPDASIHNAKSYNQLVNRQLGMVKESIAKFTNSEDHQEFLKILAVLLHSEPLVITFLTSKIRTNSIPLDETLEGYFNWRDAINASTPLTLTNLTIDSLSEWHKKLGISGFLDDPLERWRTLTRFIPRQKRLNLKGKALKAEEFYYTAEVLRRYLEAYHDVSGLPEEDDIFHPQQGSALKQRLYGSHRTADFQRSVFRQVVRQYDLDPQARLRWFHEGDTEKGFIEQFAKRNFIDLTTAGIELINLRGLGGLDSDRTRTFLDISSSEEVFAFVSIDLDKLPKNRGILDTYEKQNLLPAGFQIYDPDFEEANFTLEELVDAANKFALKNGIACNLSLEDVQEYKQETGKAVGGVIEYFWQKARFYNGKGDKWGRFLADYAVDNETPNEIKDPQGKRSIISSFYKNLRAQTSNYKFSIEKATEDNPTP